MAGRYGTSLTPAQYACVVDKLRASGMAFFGAVMAGRYGTSPTPAHYACVVDMLGRSGRFHDALWLIQEMPFEPGVLIWKTLLASCRLHGNLETGRLAAEKLMEISEGGEDRDSASHMLISGIHATQGGSRRHQERVHAFILQGYGVDAQRVQDRKSVV